MPHDARPASAPSRVLLLHDDLAGNDRADANDVLAEAAHVADAIESLGFEPLIEPVGLDLGAVERALERHAPALVFNLVESLGGRAALIHAVPALLEAQAVPFTGCSADAQFLTSNKRLAKRLLRQAAIATPEVLAPRLVDTPSSRGAWIVKSVWEHASFGLDDDSVVASGDGVPELIARRRADLGGDWFAEKFVDGRELNVGLIAGPAGLVTLPVAEILFERFPQDKPRIVGYAAKWDADSFEYARTPRTFDVDAALARRAAAIAARCWDLFGLAGYARVDFRVDAHGALWVLDVNANPCLSADAGFAAALERAGIAFGDAASWLLRDARRRVGRRAGPVS